VPARRSFHAALLALITWRCSPHAVVLAQKLALQPSRSLRWPTKNGVSPC
jgi:hypothetical protein